MDFPLSHEVQRVLSWEDSTDPCPKQDKHPSKCEKPQILLADPIEENAVPTSDVGIRARHITQAGPKRRDRYIRRHLTWVLFQ